MPKDIVKYRASRGGKVVGRPYRILENGKKEYMDKNLEPHHTDIVIESVMVRILHGSEEEIAAQLDEFCEMYPDIEFDAHEVSKEEAERIEYHNSLDGILGTLEEDANNLLCIPCLPQSTSLKIKAVSKTLFKLIEERAYVDAKTLSLLEDATQYLKSILNKDFAYEKDNVDEVRSFIDDIQGHFLKMPHAQLIYGERTGGVFDNAPLNESSILSEYGYHVGKSGERVLVRRRILDFVYGLDLSKEPRFSEDVAFYGMPFTALRLYRMAYIIAFKCRQEKAQERDNLQAINDWESDLDYLRQEYYLPKRAEFDSLFRSSDFAELRW